MNPINSMKIEKIKKTSSIWHYSFNELYRKHNIFDQTTDKQNTFCLNEFSPTLLLNNKKKYVKNVILSDFDSQNRNNRKVFWYLSLTDFNSFLDRRTIISSNPKKHYPTQYTYSKVKTNGDLQLLAFDETVFIKYYNELKKAEHLSGEGVIKSLKDTNPPFIIKYLKMGMITDNEKVVAIAMLVDDSKSMSLINIAARRSSKSYGVILCTEIVKYCCENNYSSFDAGVSGMYGVYKDKIFLDSKEVYTPKLSFSKRIIHKIKSLL
jgi:hypothetical protein